MDDAAAERRGMTLPPLFDFTTDPGHRGWRAAHDLAPLEWTADGLVLRAVGDDPYAIGPSVAVSARTPLWLTLRLKTTQTGMAQVFYWTPGGGPTEPDSIRFPVRAGGWVDVRVPIPAFDADHAAFRIDPPGDSGGVTTIARLSVEPRVEFAEPAWPKPSLASISGGVPVRSGDAAIVHGSRLDAFTVRVAGRPVAVGSDRPRIGYQTDARAPLQWLDLSGAPVRVVVRRGALTVQAQARDADGARWTVTRAFAPARRAGAFVVSVTIAVDRRRVLVYAPALIVHPLGRHDQALLCGVEYMDRQDTSSSEADLRGPQARRHVPDAYQLTIPLMASLTRGHWVSLDFERERPVAACFDVPDRRFRSGGQLLGLLFPAGARSPGSLLPSEGRTMTPGKALQASVTLRTGHGAANVLAPVMDWVADHGLPPLPDAGPLDERLRLAAAGWLDSGVHGADGRYRHAYPGDFGPQPAADAAAAQDWLGLRLGGALSERLREAATQARAAMPPDALGGVGHVPTLAATLAYGRTEAALRHSREEATGLLARFEHNGTIPYRPGKTDYGATHFAHDANGLTGQAVAAALEATARTGDPALVGAGLERLRQLDTRFRNTVPRGAQTWEVPLHTPDILASGHLVKAFVLGYELSGDRKLLEAARYWAWTGVPFVYLTRPTEGRVGLYGTTPVLGATGWIAPNWIGLPVQWCGLVYADALYDLAVHEEAGPWRRLADGIVASGWQQTHPADAGPRRGLLPDSFNLTAQIRNDVAINPATLLVPTARVLGAPLCDRRSLRPGGPHVYAPGRITPEPGGRIRIEGWPSGPYEVLISGLRRAPERILVDGRSNAFRYRIGGGWLIVTLRGTATLTLTE